MLKGIEFNLSPGPTEGSVFGNYCAVLRRSVLPDDIAADLLARHVITDGEKADIDVMACPTPVRMDKLLSAVQRGINVDKNNFHVFLEVLDKTDTRYKALAGRMKATLQGNGVRF